jgi:hypothetical protein
MVVSFDDFFFTFPIIQVPQIKDELTVREKVLGPKDEDEQLDLD